MAAVLAMLLCYGNRIGKRYHYTAHIQTHAK